MSQDLAWGALLAVSIGGADRTADLLGAGEIDRELDAAGIATVRVTRASGQPAIGAAVTISGIVDASYVGQVSGVQYDAGTDAWVVTCTDGLQALFEGAASLAAAGAAVLEGATGETIQAAQVAAILALLPTGAIWHRDLHGDWTDGWTGAQDALKTVCASVYIESGAFSSVSWSGSSYTSTLSHAAGDIYDGSVSLYLATGRELIREINATVEIGYSRQYHWQISVGWVIPDWEFCDWRLLPYALPTRQMIADAAGANPWTIIESTGLSAGGDGLGIVTQGLPATGPQCSGNWNLLAGEFDDTPLVWTNKEYGTPSESVHQASWRMGRRWSASIVETYRLTVKGTTGTLGAVVEEDARSHDAPEDPGWDASAANRAPTGTGWSSSGGLSWRDAIAAADRTAMVEGRLRTMAHRVRASQRLSTMSCTVEPGAEPALGSRVRMLAEHLDYNGQVTRLLTRWDTDAHTAGCTVTMAIGDGSTAADDFSPPDAPEIPATPEGVSLDSTVTLGFHLGGISAADPEQDDDWDGWITNAPTGEWGGTTYPVSGSQTYQAGFTLVTPDVPDAIRDTQTGSAAHTLVIDPLGG